MPKVDRHYKSRPYGFCTTYEKAKTMKTLFILPAIAAISLVGCSVSQPANQEYTDERYSSSALYSTYDPFYNPYNDPYVYGRTNTYYYNGRYYTRPVYTRPAYTRPAYVSPATAPPGRHYRKPYRRTEQRTETRSNTTTSPLPFGIRRRN